MKAAFYQGRRCIPVFFMTICFILSGITVRAEDPLIINPDDDRLMPGDRCEILEDKSGKLTIDVILNDEYRKRFIKSANIIPNYGFTGSSYWVRLNLKNENVQPVTRLLEVAFPHLDLLEFYLLDESDGLLSYESSGRYYPYKKRVINHRNYVFQFTIPPGGQRYCYLRIKTSDAMIFPLSIWTVSSFIKKIQLENLFFGIYYGIILVMIFYNLFIYFSTRDRNYLLYVLFITFFGLFQLSMNGLSFQYLWPSNPWLGIHLIPVFIGMSCFFAGLFSMRFLNLALHTPVHYRLTQMLSAAGLTLSFASFFIGYSPSVIAGQILPTIMIFVAISASIPILKKGDRSARFYMIAWAVFFAGVILSVLRVAGVIPHNMITEYGLQTGSEAQMVLLSLALADRINIMEIENDRIQKHALVVEQEKVENLNRAKHEIEEASALLGLSEERYRLIVEGSSDVIFTLDCNMNFLTANNAIAAEFSLDPQKIAGLNFMELLYSHETDQSMFGLLAKEKLEKFIETKEPVYFRAQFISAINNEPKDMQVHLEYLNIREKNEILGKMSNIADDSLLNFFISENQVYAIGNYLITAEEITHRITRNLKKYIPLPEVKLIQIALREVIINAIEHGNLNITFNEKSDAICENRYFSLIRERQNAPGMKDKKVRIEYSVSEEQISYTISDEGQGFQYDDFLLIASDLVSDRHIEHGRGLFMAKNVFDELRFNDKGNAVTLIKNTADRKQ